MITMTHLEMKQDVFMVIGVSKPLSKTYRRKEKMNEMIIALCQGNIPTKEQIKDELYNICDEVHSSCNEKCPVYDINEGIPWDKPLNNCICFKNAKKMYNFIQNKQSFILKENNVVKVYKDPITEQEEEGKAILISKRGEGSFIWEGKEVTMESWMVIFVGDDPDMMCCRTIKRKEK